MTQVDYIALKNFAVICQLYLILIGILQLEKLSYPELLFLVLHDPL